VDTLRYWDEKLFGPGESPAPLGGHDWMIERAAEMFESMSPELAGFYDLMVQRNLTDLESRKGKAFGGFCTYLHAYKVPFIFANFNGTRGDVRVFTHEMGHAFQRRSSSELPLADYVGCTSESAEIHSMSLEFLAWPQMERFFGEGAEEFRRAHLLEQLLFLPYGVAIDHFQHEVYENPEATPAERHAMWKRLEAIYLPWRNYGDLPHASDGGFWQVQRHVYIYPFYYIDYTLAATCALQFWARSREDYDKAMADYIALCTRGGSLPFRQLTASAGLVSPFEVGCLDRVVEMARDYLEF
jgi:M3 family oligoendopeptidase